MNINVDGFSAPWILDVMLIGIMIAVGIVKAEKGLYSRIMPVIITGISAVLGGILTLTLSPTLIAVFGDSIRQKLYTEMTESYFDYSSLMQYVDDAPKNIIHFLLFCGGTVTFIIILTIIKNAFGIVIELDTVVWIDKIGGFALGVFMVLVIFFFLLYVAALCRVAFIPQLTEGTIFVNALVHLAYGI